MATVYVDKQPYEMNSKQNLLHGCLSLGMNLPYFCWHPALGSVGACRQCAVKQFKDEADTHGKIVMACMTPAADGTRISILDAEAAEFRAAIIEGLMLNHPHDCPVCDEGGECHLQDMTVMTGHDYRRYTFEKRTFRNQYLGPFVNHEMNRCIQCYRCVRFYREYAGGNDLNAFALRNIVFFGRDRDGVLENEFAGNLVEVCPTGVFTDATLKRHYTRKWDLQMAPSVCVHCALGCNITAAERYGMLQTSAHAFPTRSKTPSPAAGDGPAHSGSGVNITATTNPIDSLQEQYGSDVAPQLTCDGIPTFWTPRERVREILEYLKGQIGRPSEAPSSARRGAG